MGIIVPQGIKINFPTQCDMENFQALGVDIPL
jgi:hypothetical protein